MQVDFVNHKQFMKMFKDVYRRYAIHINETKIYEQIGGIHK